MIDAVVTGHSLPALQAALDLAEVGLRVTVARDLEPDTEPIAPVRDPDRVIAAFARRVAEPVEPGHAPLAGAELAIQPHRSPLLRSTAGAWLPQAEPNVLGVPAVPLAEATLALLGGAAAARAYLDRITPLLTVGKTRMFGTLVRKRLGKAALRTLVEPQVFERYGVGAAELEVAVAAPGFNETLSRSGALTSAVLAYSDRNVARETTVQPAAGWQGLRDALLKKLEWYGVTLLDAPIADARWVEDRWVLRSGEQDAIEARALIADRGRRVASSDLAYQQTSAVHPAAIRTYAQIDIERPEWLTDGETAIAALSGVTVTLCARADETGSPRTWATLGAARQAIAPTDDLARCVRASEETLQSHVSGALDQVNVRPLAGSQWQSETVAAPDITIEARHGMIAQIDEGVAGQPMLVPAGELLHGGDLADALAWTHRATVRLRRRLLGLDESE